MTGAIHHRRDTCRICGSSALRQILSLGPMPLANAFLSSPAELEGERSFPLDVRFCEGCTFVQLVDVVAPEVLFRHYLYTSGTSDTMSAHHQSLAGRVVEALHVNRGDLVVEVASNDGSLLRCFQPFGVRVLGVEPARNIAAMASAAGIATVTEFFTPQVAVDVRAKHGPAAAVLANNVLAHVDDPREFLAAARLLVEPAGSVVVEVPYVGDLLDRLAYDTIYHEHLGYFSVGAFVALAESVDLTITRIDRIPVHGGSLRVWFSPRGRERHQHGASVLELLGTERAAGLHDLDRYSRFSAQVEGNRRQLVDMLIGMRADGRTVAAYGAPAKGNTLLNYCGITADLVAFTVDKNPLKVGLLTPGSHIPVLPVSAIAERQPDYLLLLAWNFADEIMRQQSAYVAAGGRFILPIPQPTVVAGALT